MGDQGLKNGKKIVYFLASEIFIEGKRAMAVDLVDDLWLLKFVYFVFCFLLIERRLNIKGATVAKSRKWAGALVRS